MTNTKAWYASKTAWVTIIGAIVSIAAVIYNGFTLSTETIEAIATGIAFILALIFRINATQKIGK